MLDFAGEVDDGRRRSSCWGAAATVFGAFVNYSAGLIVAWALDLGPVFIALDVLQQSAKHCTQSHVRVMCGGVRLQPSSADVDACHVQIRLPAKDVFVCACGRVICHCCAGRQVDMYLLDFAHVTNRMQYWCAGAHSVRLLASAMTGDAVCFRPGISCLKEQWCVLGRELDSVAGSRALHVQPYRVGEFGPLTAWKLGGRGLGIIAVTSMGRLTDGCQHDCVQLQR
jgi:hypothetical protein